jgi:PAS domain S-box-containing protein
MEMVGKIAKDKNKTALVDLSKLSKEQLIDYVKQLNVEVHSSKGKFNNEPSDSFKSAVNQELSLRAIFDSLDAIVWYIDRDFNLMAFNKNFYHHIKEIYGLVPQVGMNVLEQEKLASQYESVKDRIKIALEGNEKTYQDFYRVDDAIIKVVNSKIFPISVDEKIVGVGCLTNDETESFFNKERIKTNEKLLASINKNISEAIYRSNSQDGFIYINEAFVKMFGFESKEELIGFTELSSLYAKPKDREKIIKLLSKKKQFTNIEMLFRKKNGDTFTGLISSMLSVDERGIEYYDGAIRDATEIKNTQQKLKNQNLQLKKLNSELDSFVYSASHDLKAPLSSMKGLIHLAQHETDKQKLDYYLRLVDKSIDKLDNFIEDIISLSRNSRQEVQNQTIDFKVLINESLDNFKYLANYDLIKKEVQFDQNCSFRSDKIRLMMVLNNLISNSIRYYNPAASNPFLKVSVSCKNKQVQISISDNGQGIEKQYLNKIFDMFFRASNFSDGSGIGLYIVKETVEKLKGKISVESEYGIGSTFKISLPNSVFN